MLQRTLPAGFIAPCLPTKTDKLPSGSLWLHEIKHDGFRMIARKDGPRVRLYSRSGNDLTRRFPLIVETLARLRSHSCIVDGEAVACDDSGVASFDLVRHQRANESIFLYAFDLIELNGDDLRRDPLEVRKATLASHARIYRRQRLTPVSGSTSTSRATARPCSLMIYGPKNDGTYVVEFRTTGGEALAISIPMARPGTNATGFTQFEFGLAAKWLELLREITPQVARVGVVREVEGQVGIAQWAVIGAAASSLGIELTPINVHVDGETERAVAEFARSPNDGLIVVVSSTATIQRDLLIKLAARHRLPAVYPYRFFVDTGGLMSYGPNLIDGYRRSASYVDRILKGEKPADLPVQAPTKYELVINLKTAKALGLDVPPTLLARADEVIE
jgi:ABC transporter substrate binding protein/ATP dependent DNA ligase domain